jgi:hypothetical protein
MHDSLRVDHDRDFESRLPGAVSHVAKAFIQAADGRILA